MGCGVGVGVGEERKFESIFMKPEPPFSERF